MRAEALAVDEWDRLVSLRAPLEALLCKGTTVPPPPIEQLHPLRAAARGVLITAANGNFRLLKEAFAAIRC